MPVERHFLGWDAPVTRKVTDFLLPPGRTGLLDLSDTLLVVPTQQAGRRLREQLARTGESRGAGLLSGQILTPGAFLLAGEGGANVAEPMVCRAAWTRILMDADLDRMPGLFPAQVARQDFSWALHMAGLIERLRSSLAEGACRISDVPGSLEGACPEPERWRDLAGLERRYFDRLDTLGLEDPLLFRMRQAEEMVPPTNIRRIVVAAVPDPNLLVVRVLERLASEWPIQILIHAPQDIETAFDAWGRSLRDAWRDVPIEIPDEARNLLLAASPAGQARKVLSVLAEEADRFGYADVAVGVPDAGVVQPLTDRLEAHGLAAYDPGGVPAGTHPLYHLLDAYHALLANGSFDSFSRFLRHPDVLGRLGSRLSLGVRAVLEEADRFQNDHLPGGFEDVKKRMTEERGTSRYPALARAVEWVVEHVDAFQALPLEHALRGLLAEIYEQRILRAAVPRDDAFAAVAERICQGVSSASSDAMEKIGLEKPQVLHLLLSDLADERYYPDHTGAAVDLEGWLELPWVDAPLLVVTGMNEGSVPDGRLSDLFLPDSLRKALELRCDEDRLARDAYLMQTLIKARETAGRTCFVVGKTSSAGDPLKPSRLLFRCSDDLLPDRAMRLFGEADEPRDNVPLSISFQLQPGLPSDLSGREGLPDRMSVTAFKSYLACPFRFYLSTVLGMEELDDRKTALDALDFGSIVHRALELLGDSQSLRTCTDPHVLAAAFQEQAERIVHGRYGSALPLPVEIQLETARQRLAAAARVHAKLVVEGWEILECEKEISGTIGGMPVVGRIDRIDRHRKTGQIRVLDYKTSDKATPPREMHFGTLRDEHPAYAKVLVAGKERAWADLQLPLYRILLAAEGYAMDPVELGYFHLPRAVSETGVCCWDDFSDETLAAATACAEGVVRDVAARRFWPPVERVMYDDFGALFPAAPDVCVDVRALDALRGGGS